MYSCKIFQNFCDWCFWFFLKKKNAVQMLVLKIICLNYVATKILQNKKDCSIYPYFLTRFWKKKIENRFRTVNFQELYFRWFFKEKKQNIRFPHNILQFHLFQFQENLKLWFGSLFLSGDGLGQKYFTCNKQKSGVYEINCTCKENT